MSSVLVFLRSQLLVTPEAAPAGTSLEGKVGIVTGSNAGLGFNASRQLLGLGLSHLIMAVRDPARGEAAKKKLLESLSKESKLPTIDIWKLDLGDYKSVIDFVEQVKTSALKPNFAILNAGVVKFDYELNPVTSNEITIQTNWLSTALVTLLLLPVMKQSAGPNSPSTISIVGSEVAQWASFKEAIKAEKSQTSVLSQLNEKTNFSADRYNTSKLLLLLFFRELVSRRSEVSSTQVILNLVNPGYCTGSELHKNASGAVAYFMSISKKLIGRPGDIGARTLVHGGAWSGPETNGKYLSDCHVAKEATYVDTQAGKAMQKTLWAELTNELGKSVNISAVLDDI